MTFLHTSLFLAGLACVSIPILIHLLLRQRRKPIEWAAMRFLLEAYRRQRRRLKLQQLILLAVRCLALLLLAAAIARPVIDAAGFGASGGRSVYLLIDNSLASSARGVTAPAAPGAAVTDQVSLDRHKATAAALLAGLGPADRVGLIALASPTDAIVVPASSNIASVRTLIDGLRPTDSAPDLAAALERVAAQVKADEAERGSGVVLAILSDFVVGAADTSRPLPAALAEIPGLTILASPPASAAPTNTQVVAIDPLRSVVLTGAGATLQREQVRISLRRSGVVSEPAVTSLRVCFASSDAARTSPESRTTFSWLPGQSEATIAVDVEPPARESSDAAGISSALIAEIDRDAIAGDNIFRRPIGVRESLRVGIVARRRFAGARGVESLTPAEWFALALKPIPAMPIDIVEIDPQALDTPSLALLDVVFTPAPDLLTDDAWSRLRRFVDAGGLLVVSPPPEATVHLWTDAMVRELGLGWRVAREPMRYDTPGVGLDDKPETSPLLSLIAAEIPALVRPVRVSRALPVEELSRRSEVLLRLADGAPWLISGETGAQASDIENAPASGADAGRGLVLYLASAPELSWTDLPAKPLMVPLTQEITRQGFGRAAGDWSTIAGRPMDAPRGATSLRPIVEQNRPGEERDASPIILGATQSKPPAQRRAGLWAATDDAGRLRGLVAVNPDADAGRLSPNESSSVRSWLASALGESAAEIIDSESGAERADSSVIQWLDPSDPVAALSRQSARSPWSLPLLATALALAILEAFLARWFSYARVDRAAPRTNSSRQVDIDQPTSALGSGGVAA